MWVGAVFFVRFVNVRVAACVYPTAPDKINRSWTCMCVAVHTASDEMFERPAAATQTALSAALLLVSYTTLANSMGLVAVPL